MEGHGHLGLRVVGAEGNPELQDELDVNGVSDELVYEWSAAEVKMLGWQPSQPGNLRQAELPPHFPNEVRRQCLQGLRDLICDCGFEVAAMGLWLDTAFAFDSYLECARRAGEKLLVEDMPMVCTALARMTWKDESLSLAKLDFDIGAALSTFAKHLEMPDYSVDVLSISDKSRLIEALNVAEVRVLSTLGWRIHRPSTRKWTIVFLKRLSVFAYEGQRGLVRQLLDRALIDLVHLTWQEPHSLQCRPEQVARGLVILRAVNAGIQPVPWMPNSAPLGDPSQAGGKMKWYLAHFETPMLSPVTALIEDCRRVGQRLGIGGQEDKRLQHVSI